MDDMSMIGYIVSTIITLGAFIGVIMKFVQPINELRIIIQKLNDTIDNIGKDATSLDARVTEHGRQIDHLDNRVGKLETRVDLYHK